MAVCADYKIPHSAFLDWEPEDRAKAMAFMVAKADECVMCGTSGHEWEHDKNAYVPIAKFCHGCNIKKAASEGESSPGTTIELVRNTPLQRAKTQLALEERWSRRNKE